MTMPNYSRTGTEPLRSPTKTFHGSTPDSPEGGKDVGGRGNLRSGEKTLRADTPPTPKGSYGSKVEGIQTFTDGRV